VTWELPWNYGPNLMPRRYFLRETTLAETNKPAASGARPAPERPLEVWRFMWRFILIVMRALARFADARKAVVEAWRAANSS
jgi:hypothetical protein